MGMISCRGCGAELHDTAITCPHCGAPQKDTSSPIRLPYATYAEVPWYRKRWFFIICALIFSPGVILILLTGDAFYLHKGEVKAISKGAKITVLILSIAYCAWTVILALGQNQESQAITMVKGGVLQSCPARTVGQMAKGFLSDPSWESGKADDGKTYVNVSGDITYQEKPVRAMIQFLVSSTTFEFQAFEMNGVPSAPFIAITLLQKMCASAEGPAIAQSTNQSPETALSTPPAAPAADAPSAPSLPVPSAPVADAPPAGFGGPTFALNSTTVTSQAIGTYSYLGKGHTGQMVVTKAEGDSNALAVHIQTLNSGSGSDCDVTANENLGIRAITNNALNSGFKGDDDSPGTIFGIKFNDGVAVVTINELTQGCGMGALFDGKWKKQKRIDH